MMTSALKNTSKLLHNDDIGFKKYIQATTQYSDKSSWLKPTGLSELA
jgi:hypothetical protein